jgi:hypothetical protein
VSRNERPLGRQELARRSALAARRAAAEMGHRPGDRGPGDRAEPGDLFVLQQTGHLPVEWVVLERRPAMGDGSAAAEVPSAAPAVLLAVPADANPLAGSADFELPSGSPAAPLTLRCGFGVWLAEAHFDLARRTGRLGEEALRRARRLQAATIAGVPLAATPAQLEVDADPEYQEWVEKVLVQARRAVIETPRVAPGAAVAAAVPVAGAQPVVAVAPVTAVAPVAPALPVATGAPIAGGRGETRGRWRFERPYALGAALLLLLSLGLGIALAWQARRLGELAAERRRGQQLLRSARESAEVAERRAKTERQQAAAMLGQAAAAARGSAGGTGGTGSDKGGGKAGGKGERAQAPAGDEPIVNLPFVWLAADEALRGQPSAVKIPADARLVALILELGTAPALPRYRLELRQSSGQRIWSADGLRKTGTMELTVALPRRLLRPGSYSLRLYDPVAVDHQPLATYSLAVE